MSISKIYSINDHTVTELDKVISYVKGFGYEEYEEGKIYSSGSKIVKIYLNKLCALRCKVEKSSDTFNPDEWNVVSLNDDLTRWVKMPDSSRVVASDVGELKAHTDVTGRYIYDIMEEILFGIGDVDFLHDEELFIDRTANNSKLKVTLKYREKSRVMVYIKFYYDGKLILTSYLPSNEQTVEINYDGANNNSEIKYEAMYEDSDVPVYGTAVTIVETFPMYYGLITDLNQPIGNTDTFEPTSSCKLIKSIVKPNSPIEFIKENDDYGYMGMLVLDDQWRQLSKCLLEDNINITDSIFSDHVWIGGYEYKIIYTYPNMLRNIKIKFMFDDII